MDSGTAVSDTDPLRDSSDKDDRRNSPWLFASKKFRTKIVSLHEKTRRPAALPGANAGKKREGLVRAAFQGKIAYIRAALAKGIDVNSKDRDGNTALMWAIDRGNEKILQILLEYAADLDTKDKHGNTALIWAVDCAGSSVLRTLLENGADIEGKNDKGTTALMWAAGKGRLSAVKTLLACGADLNAKNNDGITAIDWAESSLDPATIGFLRKAVSERHPPLR